MSDYVRVDTQDLARVLHELNRAKLQVTELQSRMTAMVEERIKKTKCGACFGFGRTR